MLMQKPLYHIFLFYIFLVIVFLDITKDNVKKGWKIVAYDNVCENL